tara:strand:+ start:2601 stop:2765 length:165 start_codon:yes stop_codon:yes gene_type:complete
MEIDDKGLPRALVDVYYPRLSPLVATNPNKWSPWWVGNSKTHISINFINGGIVI